ncbi:MAG: hypothetical protein JRF17_09485 [Deltaproteobacteria bacterium]|jgi:hypothetical protein|nr:hypothetical protein [Deltaproteobacteria bacterium]
MDINKIGHPLQTKLSSTAKVDNDNQFKQIFDRKLDEVHATTGTCSVDSKSDVIVQSEKVLNLLDHYAGELADPARTLKDIRPLVDSIEKEVTLMETEAVNKAHNDTVLDRLVKDLAVTAKVAVYKFHRGDYI